MKRRFSDFKVGDTVIHSHTFDSEDFAAFTRLTGDRNPLHHDPDHARAAGYPAPILPVHMTLGPLSAIAGMWFPGQPSLYLKLEARAVAPVYYGDRLSYSARIVGVKRPTMTLDLHVIVAAAEQVVAEAEMLVSCRDAEWEEDLPDLPDFEFLPADRRLRCIVTGAGGAIGSAIVRELLRRDHSVIAQCRNANERVQEANRIAEARGLEFDVATADLAIGADLDRLAAYLSAQQVDVVIHAACPPLTAPLADMMQVQVAALDRLAAAVVTWPPRRPLTASCVAWSRRMLSMACGASRSRRPP
jgi:acyl dehydratase